MLAATIATFLAFQGPPSSLLCRSSAVRFTAPAMISRREMAFTAAACSSMALLPTTAHAYDTRGAEAAAKTKAQPLSIDELTRKAKSLRSYTITAAKTGTPLEARQARLIRKKTQILTPLLETMTAIA